MERITVEQAKEFIPLKENYGNTEVDYAEYFTLTPSDMGDGWEHTYDRWYPTEYANSAYQLGINYLIYSLTH